MRKYIFLFVWISITIFFTAFVYNLYNIYYTSVHTNKSHSKIAQKLYTHKCLYLSYFQKLHDISIILVIVYWIASLDETSRQSHDYSIYIKFQNQCVFFMYNSSFIFIGFCISIDLEIQTKFSVNGSIILKFICKSNVIGSMILKWILKMCYSIAMICLGIWFEIRFNRFINVFQIKIQRKKIELNLVIWLDRIIRVFPHSIITTHIQPNQLRYPLFL